MTDELLETLRRARPEVLPDELAAPDGPAATALYEEILSMTLTTDAVQSAPRRPRWRPLAAVAAAVAVALGLATLIDGSSHPSAAETVAEAAARSADALERSGRAEVTIGGDDDVSDTTYDYAFSGDEVSRTRTDNGLDELLVQVGDTLYVRSDGRWCKESLVDNPYEALLEIDAHTLLEQLDGEAGFSHVGNETVDGVDTQRLRAAHPGVLNAFETLPLSTPDGKVTALDVWVDDDSLVRRIDFTVENEVYSGGSGDGVIVVPDDLDEMEPLIDVQEFSVELSDLGEPVTIEAPEGVTESCSVIRPVD